jgi:type II secretory pathway component PulF
MTEQPDYASSSDEAKHLVSPLPTMIAYWIVYIVVGGVLFVAAPTFEDMFSTFKTELPLTTRMTLGFGRWFRAIGWLLLLPFPIMIPLVLARLPQSKSQRRTRGWRIVGLTSIALLVLGVVRLLSLWLPLVNVTWGVSSPRR